jgi:predicted ferric reductase
MAGVTLAPLVSLGPHAPTLSALTAAGRTLWYLTRTTAVAAYVTLTLSVMLGLLRTIARASAEPISWMVDELHAFVATLAGLCVAGHVLTIRLDDYVTYTWRSLLIPGDGPYRPTAVNLGICAFYLLVLLLLSSWLRRFVAYRLWRVVHYLSFVAFALVTLHGWLAGSDASEPWMRALYVGASAGVGYLTLMRLFARPKARNELA